MVADGAALSNTSSQAAALAAGREAREPTFLEKMKGIADGVNRMAEDAVAGTASLSERFLRRVAPASESVKDLTEASQKGMQDFGKRVEEQGDFKQWEVGTKERFPETLASVAANGEWVETVAPLTAVGLIAEPEAVQSSTARPSLVGLIAERETAAAQPVAAEDRRSVPDTAISQASPGSNAEKANVSPDPRPADDKAPVLASADVDTIIVEVAAETDTKLDTVATATTELEVKVAEPTEEPAANGASSEKDTELRTAAAAIPEPNAPALDVAQPVFKGTDNCGELTATDDH